MGQHAWLFNQYSLATSNTNGGVWIICKKKYLIHQKYFESDPSIFPFYVLACCSDPKAAQKYPSPFLFNIQWLYFNVLYPYYVWIIFCFRGGQGRKRRAIAKFAKRLLGQGGSPEIIGQNFKLDLPLEYLEEDTLDPAAGVMPQQLRSKTPPFHGQQPMSNTDQ